MITRTVVALALASLTPFEARADPQSTVATGGGVRLEGLALASSVGITREPSYTLTNLTDATRVVTLVWLVSLGESERHVLRLTGPRRVVLRPHATQEISVAFEGRPIHRGGGLGHYRFALTVSVGGAHLVAVASNAYVCRIPLRRPETP